VKETCTFGAPVDWRAKTAKAKKSRATLRTDRRFITSVSHINGSPSPELKRIQADFIFAIDRFQARGPRHLQPCLLLCWPRGTPLEQGPSMTSINYLRYVSYALFAIGLINLRYQSGEDNLAVRTFIIVGTGAVLFALTFSEPGKKLLSGKVGKSLAWLVAITATIFAILN